MNFWQSKNEPSGDCSIRSLMLGCTSDSKASFAVDNVCNFYKLICKLLHTCQLLSFLPSEVKCTCCVYSSISKWFHVLSYHWRQFCVWFIILESSKLTGCGKSADNATESNCRKWVCTTFPTRIHCLVLPCSFALPFKLLQIKVSLGRFFWVFCWNDLTLVLFCFSGV